MKQRLDSKKPSMLRRAVHAETEGQIGPAPKPPSPVVHSKDTLLRPLRGSTGFVGRTDMLRRILQVLMTTSDIALLVKGESGTGKTSLIHLVEELLDDLVDGGQSFRYLSTKPSGRASLENRMQIRALLDDLVAGGRSFRYFPIEPSSLASLEGFARELWRGVLRCVGSPETTEWKFSIDTFDEFSANLELVRQRAVDTTFIVFLDDFDRIFHNGDCPELERTRIRGLINYLVVSTDFPIVFFFSVLQDLPQHYGSAVPTLPLTLHVLTSDETAELTRRILAGYFVPSDDEIAWLYEYCGGHPYLTRLLLAKLLEQTQQGISEQPPPLSGWESAAQAAVESGQAKEFLGNLYESYLNDDQRYILLWFTVNRASVVTADQVARLGARLRLAFRELCRARLPS